jgi:hypothetical protein
MPHQSLDVRSRRNTAAPLTDIPTCGHFDRQPLTSTQKGASLIGLEQPPQWASSPDSLHIEML